MQIDGIFNDRQTQSGALDVSYITGPVKRLKQIGDFVLRDANALIQHFEYRVGAVENHPKFDCVPVW